MSEVVTVWSAAFSVVVHVMELWVVSIVQVVAMDVLVGLWEDAGKKEERTKSHLQS